MLQSPTLKSLGHLSALLIGIATVVWMISTVGLSAIDANLSAIGSWFLLLVGLYLFAQLAFMAGWWVVMDEPVRSLGFLNVLGVYLAGDAMNYLVASGNVAGEGVKAYLLRGSLGLSQALPSIVIHKHAELLAQWLFLVVGLGFGVSAFDLPMPLVLVAAVSVAGLGGTVALMTWALRRGTCGAVLRRFAAWGSVPGQLRSYQPSAEALDAQLRAFYTTRMTRFLVATTWCLAAWCGGLVETYIVLQFLAPSRGWIDAFTVETLALSFNNLLLFIPARIGSAEGARAGACVLIGLPAAQGITYGLVRRGRELLWIIPGLMVLLGRYAEWLGRPGAALWVRRSSIG